MKSFAKIDNIREIRKKLGLNQIDFWGQIGVTQSGGSRYESGRNMPKPVRELLRLVHVERINLANVNQNDMTVLALLKEKHADLYADLKKEAKAINKKK
ncbi:transcriptional regulator [Neisseria sp. ZJ106]|uniref:Transcriptional regulator n=1 Tax=Neisseria lisongii TaxID=2912188 RepID=A0ABY7RJ91_9NEIS|nr:helix-turn-helix domain-containing protein [Neisseria lisongii]MCF7521898.1 transcriptional regulator [Neisseria lisongii]WCL71140.1 transcriptional regulator [Neisseria lisongii]